MKNTKKKMRLSKFTRLTLSALMVLTCVHFSSVKAEDSSVEGSSSPETVEIVEEVVKNEEVIPEGKRKCSGCGEIIDDADVFCANCGTKKEETEGNK